MGKYKDDYSGIYGIFCVEDNKWYVGRSKTVRARQGRHKTDLRDNRHPNTHLQAAWNLYGEDKFLFSTLEKCSSDLPTLKFNETKWCLHYNAHIPEFGFSMGLPDTKTEETIQKIKETRLINKITRPEKLHIIIGINIKTKELKEYKNVTDIVNTLSVKQTKLYKVLKYWRNIGNISNGKKSTMDHIFIYKEDYNADFDYINYKKPIDTTNFFRGRRPTTVVKQTNLKTHSEWSVTKKPIITINTESGEELEFESIAQCISQLNLAKDKVYKLLKNEFGKYKHRGYYLRYKSVGDSL